MTFKISPSLTRRSAGWAAFVILIISSLFIFQRRDSSVSAPAVKAVSADQSIANPASNVFKLESNSPQLNMIKTVAVQSAPMPIAEPLSARLAYDESVTSRVSVAFSGRVVRLIVKPGDSVRAGDPLAEIDSPDFGSAQSDSIKAKADGERKRLAFERARELLQGDVIPRKDFESAQADLAQANAETERTVLRLRNMNPRGDANGQRMKLTSPLTGLVTERNVNPGMEVNPALQTPLFVVSDIRLLWLMIDLPEHLLGRIAPGQTVQIDVDAYPDRSFKGVIRQVAPVVDSNSRRITVRADVANPDRALRPEMFVRASVLEERGLPVVKLPNSALITEGLYTFAFVEQAPGEFVRRRLQLGLRGGEFSYVSAGLADGERVVVSGALLLNSQAATSSADL